RQGKIGVELLVIAGRETYECQRAPSSPAEFICNHLPAPYRQAVIQHAALPDSRVGAATIVYEYCCCGKRTVVSW
ncbi:MAG TPA: hypothetical protein VIU62_12820, partial [Chloroflexota bacterium]